MINADNKVLEQTTGQFEDQDEIFQALFELPKISDLYSQVCTFVVDGVDAGVCIRCDRSRIIKSQSDLLALRVVSDSELLKSLT